MDHRWQPRAPWPPDLVRPVPVDPSGVAGPTKRQAAGPYWRRTSSGLHVPADTRSDRVEQRILEQSARLPPGGAVTGWAACRVHGAAFFDGLARDGRTRVPVQVAVGPAGRLRAGPDAVGVHHVLLDEDLVVRHGIPVVVGVRAAYDAVRLAPDPRAAVVSLDMALAGRIATVQDLVAYAARQPRGRWVVHRAIRLASPHSRSPRETELRLIWILDAGLPQPLVNCEVRDLDGRFLGIADLIDVEAGLVVEYDGAHHRTAARQSDDLRREDGLRRVGLEVVRVAGQDRRDRVVRRLQEARSRCRFEAPEKRRWVVIPA
ncbi:hypothetical protein ASG49_15415 [Marmoricola sp. Leaf446]|uniref:DUF559 domain-containing protein n=1 Tax=Marmoricola sp. Leaf446 TaxID=1736379 RepID=UPI0006FA8D3D|nr:DUF559 domain-containing protein [Marmoricola sp. Leaf446]KQT89193.1 hypothetical protein ASG49_15415 [Marmoricola sp. Leaf446]